jgi:putative ATP-binding cassette transporter
MDNSGNKRRRRVVAVTGLGIVVNWGLIASAVVFGAVSGLAGAGIIAVIDRALFTKGLEDIPMAEDVLPWGFAALAALTVTARGLSAYLMARLGQSFVSGLRTDLSRKILAAPYAQLRKLGPARLLACLTEDVSVLSEAMAFIPELCVNGALILGCLLYIGWLSPRYLGLVIGVAMLGVLVFRRLERGAVRGFEAARRHEDRLHGCFRGLIEGAKELKLHRPRRRSFLEELLEPAALHCRDASVAGRSAYIVAANFGNSLFYLVIGLIVFAGPRWPELAEEGVTSGCALAALYLMPSLAALLDGMPVLGRAGIAMDRVRDLGRDLETDPAIAGDRAAEDRCSLPQTLEFIGVSHAYRRDDAEHPFVFGPASFKLDPGEVVFLIGGNGSGKSTLALLLVGLLVPEMGAIRLGGRLIVDSNREEYRQHFSAVFSDFFLFERLLGLSPERLDRDAEACLKLLRLDKKVRIRDGAFSTLDLSLGQRKRLALLVSYLEDRPFYVFDEWAADQDPAFKKIFYTEILPSLKARGKTVVAITHDDNYFHLADRCFKLAEGKLAEERMADSPRGCDLRSAQRGVFNFNIIQ